MQIVACVEVKAKSSSASSSALPSSVRKIARGRTIGDAADREPHAVFAGDRGAGDDGEIAVAPREFAERVAVAGACGRELDRFDQFIVAARGRHQAGEEILCRHSPQLLLRRQFDSCL